MTTYKIEKRCCSICDAKKVCHVCGDQTLLACSDCQINFAATVYVCSKSDCRDEHERKCYAVKQQHLDDRAPELARRLIDAEARIAEIREILKWEHTDAFDLRNDIQAALTQPTDGEKL